ncbi:enoyl-CoA hydratase/isomerase family protein [Roseomonas marmotae]|uniref:Enoyl-CoA hydratase/isomerase family protein n=1 Tax=Roseomonas marmotae TaxID=2768161 RepID=A0ABS3KC61_9PROT|nr:enoyl-CoA hydratase/isomerase family protein [Roseomonas marmotae]MBO1075052.1 enoyl-CoA hydratase/isomerase family protein [Roseomonas marmotae]QTI79916.1 enoyl-CoA hydratase/isomerase family protein [Roseomonas marmotae]
MELTTIQLEVAEGVAAVTLNRPPVNAQNRRLREELLWLFDTLSDREDVRAIVLTGAGKNFSAGADIKERVGLVQEPGDYLRHNRLTREFFHCVADCAKPVICAVNGAAIGAGFALMSCCDILLMAEDAFVQMPELDVGLAGGAAFLLRHFSPSTARMMFFTGRRVPARELYRRGIIEACLPGDQLLPAALEMAREIAAKSPVAVSKAKHAFGTVETMPFRDGYRYEQGVTVELSRTEDAREAQRAFVEKRAPVFRGC